MRLPLTDRELDLMDVLWRRGPSTAAEVREQLQARGLDLAYNTVQTILRILEDKAYVGHTAEGRAHRFHPLVERQAVGASALARTLDRLFGGSAEALVSHLVRQRGLSRDELASLRRLLDEELGPAPAPRRGGRAP